MIPNTPDMYHVLDMRFLYVLGICFSYDLMPTSLQIYFLTTNIYIYYTSGDILEEFGCLGISDKIKCILRTDTFQWNLSFFMP